jgi:hypothetical protein
MMKSLSFQWFADNHDWGIDDARSRYFEIDAPKPQQKQRLLGRQMLYVQQLNHDAVR